MNPFPSKLFLDLEKLHRLFKSHTRLPKYKFYVKHVQGKNYLAVVSVESPDIFCMQYVYEEEGQLTDTEYIEMPLDLVEEIKGSLLKDIRGSKLELEVPSESAVTLPDLDISYSKDAYPGSTLYFFTKILPNDFAFIFAENGTLFSYDETDTKLQFLEEASSDCNSFASFSRVDTVSCLKLMQGAEVYLTNNLMRFSVRKPFELDVFVRFKDLTTEETRKLVKPSLSSKEVIRLENLSFNEQLKIYYVEDKYALSEEQYRFLPDKFVSANIPDTKPQVVCALGFIKEENLLTVRATPFLIKAGNEF